MMGAARHHRTYYYIDDAGSGQAGASDVGDGTSLGIGLGTVFIFLLTLARVSITGA